MKRAARSRPGRTETGIGESMRAEIRKQTCTIAVHSFHLE
ncbi:hypothetical protein CCC_01157 [Paramagnetospirillum magnetotacticum MS-1]|uniref:Uncharacterized protein n=1 Tax=Paramagnetospirillum magnetotacticum MS-1 TaxID=272627 RepID=A0A0C2UZ68_PARME|nr:hypothetical protein CCC_01157 [Paramagnetospirillum magnetotacticum MS-1]